MADEVTNESVEEPDDEEEAEETEEETESDADDSNGAGAVTNATLSSAFKAADEALAPHRATPPVVDTQGETVSDDDDDDLAADFRPLYGAATQTQDRFMKLAVSAEQGGDPGSAMLLREIAGGVVDLVKDLAASCGGAFQEAESRLGDVEDAVAGESHLSTEDAADFHNALLSNARLVKELLEQTPESAPNREALEALERVNNELAGRVLDISDYEPPDAPPTVN